jgi:hypothetical protein
MPRGDKSSYTDKQKRQAEHIEEGYEHRGVGKEEAERRAWATVNKETGGGNKSGSGRGVPDTNVSSKRGGRIGGPPGGSAIALREKGGRNPQAKCDGKLRGAQGWAKEIGFKAARSELPALIRPPAQPVGRDRLARRSPRRTGLSAIRRSRHWAARR